MSQRPHIAPTQTQHIGAVMLEDGSARLTKTTVSTSANLLVPEASRLADDIEAVLDPTTDHLMRETYIVTPTDNGADVGVRNGSFHVPWRFITTVVAQLRESWKLCVLI